MNKRTILFILMIMFIANSFSQDTIHLWPGKVPGEEKEKAPAVVSEKKDRNVTRIDEVTDPLITVHKPEKSKNNGTGIIICPGGGYYILAIDLEGSEIAEWLSDLGFTAFVLQYRVPQKQTGALMDAQRAMRIVRSQSDEWGIKKDKIGILGFSAGGSLAARTSTLYEKQTYEPIDDKDKISCRPDFSLLIYSAYLDKGENKTLTPELEVDSLVPPMFLFATADDKHANSALVMTGALRNANVPVELHILPEGGHGYGIRQGNIAGETWPALAEKWLNRFILKDD